MGITVKFKSAVLTASAIISAVTVLLLSGEIRQGVIKGLSLSFSAVIPSLFLFTTAALFIIKSGASKQLGRLVSPVTRPIIGLDFEQSTVFLISLIAGYPIGARLLNTLYQDGKISRAKALKMLMFSINAGPAFIITTVGECFLKSRGDGTRLMVCHLLASLIMAVTVRFLPDRLFSRDLKIKKQSRLERQNSALSDIFVLSTAEAGKTMLSVTVFVVFFAGVGGGLSAFDFPGINLIKALLEVTSGLADITRQKLPLAAFLLGFGGISVIFQVISSAEQLKPKFTVIFLSRLVHGTISALLIITAEILFPRNLATGSFNQRPDSLSVHTSPISAISLLILCLTVLFFIGSSSKQNKFD